MNTDVVYLDHNATTPVAPEVLDAMLPYLREQFGNPSSTHPLGQRAAAAVAHARAQVAALIGAPPEAIVFTSGGTEANNLAIRGAATANPQRRRIVATNVEHPATTAPLAHLAQRGWTVTHIPATPAGAIRADDAVAAIGPDVSLVSVMLAQNETGALQPVAELAATTREHGAVLHTDAAQAIGKVDVNIDALGVDLLSIAGHKCYAPKGVGALYVRPGTRLQPVLLGANQEGGIRPGTENVAGIVGLGAAADLAARDRSTEAARVGQLRNRLWQGLRSAIPALVRHTPEDSLPNTLMVSVPNVLGREVLEAAPSVAASTGSACHAGHDTPAATLLAMGISPEVALGAVRLSLGRGTTPAHIDQATQALSNAWRQLTQQ